MSDNAPIFEASGDPDGPHYSSEYVSPAEAMEHVPYTIAVFYACELKNELKEFDASGVFSFVEPESRVLLRGKIEAAEELAKKLWQWKASGPKLDIELLAKLEAFRMKPTE